MKRRRLIVTLGSLPMLPLLVHLSPAGAQENASGVEKIHHTEEEWREILTPEQFEILREEGTEPAWSSPWHAITRCSVPKPSTTVKPAGPASGAPCPTP